MIQHVWTIYCAKAIQDKDTNNVTIVDNIEKLTMTVPPDVPDNINIAVDQVLVSMWFNDDEKDGSAGVLRITIVAPSGRKINTIEVDFTIKPLAFSRIFAKLKGFALFGPGVYRFVIHVKATGDSRWKRVATIPVVIEYNITEGATLTPLPIEPFSEAGDEHE